MKKLLCLVLALAMMIPLVAFANDTIELTYYFPTQTSGPLAIGMEEIVNSFNASQDKIHVTATFTGDYAGCLEKTLTAIAGGNAPNVVLLSTNISDLLSVDALVDLNTLIASEPADFLDDYVPGFFTLFQYPGDHLWAIPFQHSATLFYYNQDVLTAAGIEKAPVNYTELEAACRAIKAYDPKIIPFSFMGDVWITEALALANGGAIHTDWDHMCLENEQLVETITFFKKLLDEDLAIVDNSYGGASENFMAESVAMMTNTSGSMSSIANTATFNWDITGMPSGDGKDSAAVIGGGGLHILSAGHSDEEVNASWEFVKYMTSPEVSATWMKTSGYFAVRYSAYNQPILTELFAEKPQYASTVNFLPLVVSPYLLSKNQNDVQTIFKLALDEIYLNNADIRSTLHQAQLEAQALLD